MAASQRRHGASAQERRAALLRATVEVAAEGGAAAVTHRAVTEKAGLPLATVGYFFDSINDLAAEAFRVHVEQAATQQIVLADGLAQLSGNPDDITAAFAAMVAAPDQQVLAMFEAYLYSARRRDLELPVGDAIASSRAVAAAAVQAGGLPDPHTMAPALAALAHGFRLHRLADPEAVDSETVHTALRALIAGFLVLGGHTEIVERQLARERADPQTQKAASPHDRPVP
ncbi:TetR/AcrR family transcriptional regulator [Nocardia asteroides]|uniref:TetR/AcrR family transcriptional regulator n=1 Tax=Nocardia asteroides TaxID=1824 RepID=UPI0037CBBE1F